MSDDRHPGWYCPYCRRRWSKFGVSSACSRPSDPRPCGGFRSMPAAPSHRRIPTSSRCTRPWRAESYGSLPGFLDPIRSLRMRVERLGQSSRLLLLHRLNFFKERNEREDRTPRDTYIPRQGSPLPLRSRARISGSQHRRRSRGFVCSVANSAATKIKEWWPVALTCLVSARAPGGMPPHARFHAP